MSNEAKKEKDKGIHSYRLANGQLRWAYVIYVVREGKSRPFWFKGFTTKTAALEKKKELLRLKETLGPQFRPEAYQRRQNPRTYEAPNLHLFDKIVVQWLNTKETAYEAKKLSKSRLYACTRSVNDFILPTYTGKPMSEVTRASWVKKLDEMTAEGHSWHIRKQATSCLSIFLTYAADRGYIPVNPLLKMSSVLGEPPPTDRAPLTEEERRKFLAAARLYRDGKYYALVHGMLEGPRPGEQLAMEIDGFYPALNMIRLKWNYTQEGLKPLPKDQEERYLPLTTETTQLYIIQAERATREQLDAGLPPRWLFPNLQAEGDVKLYRDRKLREIFYAICRLAQIRRTVPYEGRTTAACTIYNNGGTLGEVMDHLGHSNRKTSRIYTKRAWRLGPRAVRPGPRPVDLLNLPVQPVTPATNELPTVIAPVASPRSRTKSLPD